MAFFTAVEGMVRQAAAQVPNDLRWAAIGPLLHAAVALANKMTRLVWAV